MLHAVTLDQLSRFWKADSLTGTACWRACEIQAKMEIWSRPGERA